MSTSRLPSYLADGLITLRPVTVDDWPLVQALSRDEAVARWTTIPADLDDDAAKARITRAIDRFSDGSMGLWLIERDGEPCGNAGLGITAPDSVEIFYVVAPSQRGAGIATTAARLLTEWAQSVGYTTVTLLTFPDNAASRRVAERAGFSSTGTVERQIKGQDHTLILWQADA